MKVGIDSYCFHRFFGEVYPDQDAPEKKMTMVEFLDFAKEMDVDGVSLETCFFDSFDDSYLMDLKAQLDEYGFDRVFAWGHPDGLERGKNPEAFAEINFDLSLSGDSSFCHFNRLLFFAEIMDASLIKTVLRTCQYSNPPVLLRLLLCN